MVRFCSMMGRCKAENRDQMRLISPSGIPLTVPDFTFSDVPLTPFIQLLRS